MKAEEQQVINDIMELGKEVLMLRAENNQLKERIEFLEKLLLSRETR